ncbi:carbohydrate kinase family protein [Aeropyrum camini]|uniref:ATP-dependent 6-phosphofructokinase n=1 Tax=Aeropyrum camini SY1 = JCM 12091 TaxID=1198449 RepID=U3TB67_9CREN|nr:carbohydrate kinase family protein [Aeropyrum camini]BAN90787.1 ATP-dependent 6-phosphofructokinase [Aeropyrum camini SY1 = JCM 12091]
MVLPGPGVQTHIAVGNINLDISLSVDRLPGPEEVVFARDAWIGVGGAATNYAIAVAFLGQKPVLVAVAGREMERLGVVDMLKSRGVDVSRVRTVDRPSGVVVVMVVASDSHRSMVSMRGANEELLKYIEEEPLEGAGGECHVHMASVPPQALDYAPRGCTLSYDPGGEAFKRPKSLWNRLQRVDWMFINTSELRGMSGNGDLEAASRLLESGLRRLVLKHGRGGATVIERGLCLTLDRTPVLEPIDVTGAGDAFDAAFNIAVKAGWGIGGALRLAVAAGSAKVLKRGSSNMPTAAEVLAMLPRVASPRECSLG